LQAGIPGVSDRLLEKYEVRVVAYDRPGVGQSDPHPTRNFNTSAQDMADIADALGMGEKFWVMGYSSGGPHAWAALHYIPHRLAGMSFLWFIIYGSTHLLHLGNASWKYPVAIGHLGCL
jgi:pimeloyl-ACP methyl ester carboxylesterase